MNEYIRTVNYWTAKEAESKKNGTYADEATLLQTAEQILSAHKNGVLATAYKNQARATPVDYSYHNHAIYIFSEGGKKFASVQQKVGFAVYNQDGTFGNLKSVQLSGNFELVKNFSEEYNQLAGIRGISVDYLKKMERPMFLIKIVPEEITILDSELKKAGFDSRGTIHCNFF